MAGMPVLPLASLAAAAFALATSELMMMGLLPELAESLDVSIPKAGLLVTGYAVGVVIAAPVMALITNGVARKRTLLMLMAIFIVGNIVCALAPNYTVLLAARVFTAFCHAALFGIAAVIAADITPRDRQAMAVALVFGGVTVATILGVPLGTAIGQEFGWRAAFWMVVAMGGAAAVTVVIWLPSAIPVERVNLRQELATIGNRQVAMALVVSGFLWAGLFVVFTYVAPILGEVAGASEEAIVWVFLIFGLGTMVGNFMGGRLADWKMLPSIVGMIAVVAVMLAVIAVVAHSIYLAVVALVIWGVFIFALIPALQIWVVRSARDAPNVASIINQGSLHLGAAVGAWLGASALYFGINYRHLPWVGEFLTLTALAIAVVAMTAQYKHRKAAFAESPRSAAVAAGH
ncbi:MFS transporter [Bauldia sp.]|uniref:MFS transporter n=1 Tax=Bauldia sp. TaxID=2575872 RepID=UPI003BAA7599